MEDTMKRSDPVQSETQLPTTPQQSPHENNNQSLVNTSLSQSLVNTSLSYMEPLVNTPLSYTEPLFNDPLSHTEPLVNASLSYTEPLFSDPLTYSESLVHDPLSFSESLVHDPLSFSESFYDFSEPLNPLEASFQEIPPPTEHVSEKTPVQFSSDYYLPSHDEATKVRHVVDDLKPRLPTDNWKTALVEFEVKHSPFLLSNGTDSSHDVSLRLWPNPTQQEFHLLPELAVRMILSCNQILNLDDGNYAILKTIFALSQVSKNFNKFTNCNFVWLVLCQESFPGFVYIRNCLGLQYNYKNLYQYFRSMHLQSPCVMKLYFETSLSACALMNIEQFVIKNQLPSVTFAINRITNLLGKYKITPQSPLRSEDIYYLEKIPDLLSILCENISLHFRKQFLPHPEKMSPSDLFVEVARSWSLLQNFVRVVSFVFLPLCHLYGIEPLSHIFFPNLKEISYNGFRKAIFSDVQDICLMAIKSGTVPVKQALLIRPMFVCYRVETDLPESEEHHQNRPPIYVLLSPQDSDRTVRCEIELLKDAEVLQKQFAFLVCGEEDVDDTAPNPLPVPFTLQVLLRVMEYAKMQRDRLTEDEAEPRKEEKNSALSEPVMKWLGGFSQALLFEVILAANSINYKPLLDATCKCVANMIKGKTPEEIRKTFNIKNDFTPEEEEKIRRENEWCEER